MERVGGEGRIKNNINTHLCVKFSKIKIVFCKLNDKEKNNKNVKEEEQECHYKLRKDYFLLQIN